MYPVAKFVHDDGLHLNSRIVIDLHTANVDQTIVVVTGTQPRISNYSNIRFISEFNSGRQKTINNPVRS